MDSEMARASLSPAAAVWRVVQRQRDEAESNHGNKGKKTYEQQVVNIS